MKPDRPSSAKLPVVEQFEAWLHEHGIEITGQVMTGSGDMLRLRLRLPDGAELDVAISGAIMAERPYEAIELVRQRIESHETPQQQHRTNGHT